MGSIEQCECSLLQPVSVARVAHREPQSEPQSEHVCKSDSGSYKQFIPFKHALCVCDALVAPYADSHAERTALAVVDPQRHRIRLCDEERGALTDRQQISVVLAQAEEEEVGVCSSRVSATTQSASACTGVSYCAIHYSRVLRVSPTLAIGYGSCYIFILYDISLL